MSSRFFWSMLVSIQFVTIQYMFISSSSCDNVIEFIVLLFLSFYSSCHRMFGFFIDISNECISFVHVHLLDDITVHNWASRQWYIHVYSLLYTTTLFKYLSKFDYSVLFEYCLSISHCHSSYKYLSTRSKKYFDTFLPFSCIYRCFHWSSLFLATCVNQYSTCSCPIELAISSNSIMGRTRTCTHLEQNHAIAKESNVCIESCEQNQWTNELILIYRSIITRQTFCRL
jgi:hypothetical protein